mmetsp:Transcript_20542/g.36512  ORF Transcript_20542/g.36512 Transcript_20542/m.36512 type:complete len:371 (+) Transcript_20542:121-1233(+)|eukprot:CAMPEP_0201939392 /NCGR_PEP_ID=MMETSP0903-20130614/43104_1 /ASSEMBLY_ACC=CAM_ASM_000552 /TAXON_ID=420261 /ORGANISM="Thalassiosira antarctica, Strain CCMP982" /LENGTH=370 /DNA_ID=CAMNT_0048480907 /DNA_START=76 /DNA_END=1188 /DNA_ORIENTATION=+
MAATTTGDNLRSLIFKVSNGKASFSVLDQLLLPHETKYVPVNNVEDAWDAIRSMRIRGAPLIAIVAVLGLSVDLTSNEKTIQELGATDDVKGYIYGKMAYLKTSRPTAVNLFNAMEELKDIVQKAPSSREQIIDVIITHAQFMLERDVSDNKAIGTHGADDLLSRHNTHPDGVRLVTICNTGSLATAGWGTALGVARELQLRGKLRSIAALETRPYNQGSRLTAYEIKTEGMNGTLVCDSMAASYIKSKGADACVVGADRVCANGDTANKIGTFTLAIIAKEMGVEFFVASPFTTLDVKLESGDQIEIEERPAGEMIESSGAPKDMPCWNPAFDVTPAEYITGIITEKGVLKKSADGSFDVKGFVKKHSS